MLLWLCCNLHNAITGTFPTTYINCGNTAMHVFAFVFVLDLLLKLYATAGLTGHLEWISLTARKTKWWKDLRGMTKRSKWLSLYRCLYQSQIPWDILTASRNWVHYPLPVPQLYLIMVANPGIQKKGAFCSLCGRKTSTAGSITQHIYPTKYFCSTCLLAYCLFPVCCLFPM